MTRFLNHSDTVLIRSDTHEEHFLRGSTQTPPPAGANPATNRAGDTWVTDRDLQTLWSTQLSLRRRARTRAQAILVHDRPNRRTPAPRLCAERDLPPNRRVSGVRQHQLKFAIIQDVPHWLPVDAGRLHGHMRATVCRQPLRQAQKVRRGRLESTNFRRHLAIGYNAQAGHHRLFVNVKATTASMQQLHLRSPLCRCVVGEGSRYLEL